jgi:hypothetical protein
MCAAQTCNEVILEGSDSAFGSIAAMDIGRSKLEIDIDVLTDQELAQRC